MRSATKRKPPQEAVFFITIYSAFCDNGRLSPQKSPAKHRPQPAKPKQARRKGCLLPPPHLFPEVSAPPRARPVSPRPARRPRWRHPPLARCRVHPGRRKCRTPCSREALAAPGRSESFHGHRERSPRLYRAPQALSIPAPAHVSHCRPRC